MKLLILLPLILALSVPLVYAQEYANNTTVTDSITIPISFQEISGISGGGWSTTITNNFTTVQLTGILNHNQFDVTNVQAKLDMYDNDQIFCTVISVIPSLNIGETGNFVWTCPVVGVADEANGIILGYDLPPVILNGTGTGILNSTGVISNNGTIGTINGTDIGN